MRFTTTVLASGKTATGLCIPPEVVESLGAGKRPPVRITIDGYSYRSTIAVMGGRYMVGVSAEHRAGAGVAAGDVVAVDIELDTAPREVVVPPDLAEALAGDLAAKSAFEALSYSNQLRHVLSVEGAKTTETRHRRIDKTLEALREA